MYHLVYNTEIDVSITSFNNMAACLSFVLWFEWVIDLNPMHWFGDYTWERESTGYDYCIGSYQFRFVFI